MGIFRTLVGEGAWISYTGLYGGRWAEKSCTGRHAALITPPDLFPAARSLGDPGQPSGELISICYKLENQHFPFSWPEAQSFPSNLNCI